MGSLDAFQQHRPSLLSIAYRMLGSAADAEDALQDTWLRWQPVDESEVRNAKGWLSSALVRICIDVLKSPRRNEPYPGTWLPEPVKTVDPIERETISIAFMVLLESLTPVERAVFLLHKVFDNTHEESAAILGMKAPAVRQAFHRAQKHVTANQPRFAPSEEDHARLLGAFGAALAHGDSQTLTQILAADATLWADGGGKVRGAAARPVRGGTNVALFFLGLREKTPGAAQWEMAVERVNGWPALVARHKGKIVAVVTIETDGLRIVGVRNIVNPDKLQLASVN